MLADTRPVRQGVSNSGAVIAGRSGHSIPGQASWRLAARWPGAWAVRDNVISAGANSRALAESWVSTAVRVQQELANVLGPMAPAAPRPELQLLVAPSTHGHQETFQYAAPGVVVITLPHREADQALPPHLAREVTRAWLAQYGPPDGLPEWVIEGLAQGALGGLADPQPWAHRSDAAYRIAMLLHADHGRYAGTFLRALMDDLAQSTPGRLELRPGVAQLWDHVRASHGRWSPREDLNLLWNGAWQEISVAERKQVAAVLLALDRSRVRPAVRVMPEGVGTETGHPSNVAALGEPVSWDEVARRVKGRVWQHPVWGTDGRLWWSGEPAAALVQSLRSTPWSLWWRHGQWWLRREGVQGSAVEVTLPTRSAGATTRVDDPPESGRFDRPPGDALRPRMARPAFGRSW